MSDEKLINAPGYSDLDIDRDYKVDLTAGGMDIDLSSLSGVLRVSGGNAYAGSTLDDVADGTSYKRVAASQLSSGIYIDATTTVKGIASFNSADFTLTAGAVSILDSGIAHSGLTGTHNLTTDIDHNLLTNYAANRHFLQSEITTVGTITVGVWNGTTIAIANGGSGQITQQAAINTLTNVVGATNEHVLTKDTATGNAVFKAAAGGSGMTYTDRGDPSAYDYTVANFTTDETWRDLNLSSIVGAQACLVHLVLRLIDDAANRTFLFRENGNTNVYNKAGGVIQVANLPQFFDVWVQTDANGIIEYWGTNTTFSGIDLVVRGWLS